MAAVIGESITDPSRFHNIIANPQSQHQHSRDSPLYRSVSRSSRRSSSVTTPTHPPSQSRTSATTSSATSLDADAAESQPPPSTRGPLRLPSPPVSSSPPTSAAGSVEDVRHEAATPMESSSITATTTGPTPSSGPASSHNLASSEQQPSPPSDDSLLPTPAQATSPSTSQSPRQSVIHVRDLAHVQSLARADGLGREGAGMLSDPPLEQRKFEISGMPIGDVIEMVAALLTKITTTNDMQHDAMSRNVTHQQQAIQSNDANGGSHMSPLSHSVLAFHGKNVPAITILSYLSRIHKYCPTTFEVFLSLLVYFDRMTERVNDMVTKSEEARRQRVAAASATPPTGGAASRAASEVADSQMRDAEDSESSDDSDSDLADDDDDDSMVDTHPQARSHKEDAPTAGPPSIISSPTYFVVDSFNIHRLIIAGVTCASKFFSDVFYTNSRYAKVGGLPLPELNHLEIQFLVLNDFRLAVPVEDLEAYATMLVEFYAREVVAPRLAAEQQ